MKTEDLIHAYLKEHPPASSDSERDRKHSVAKPVIPVSRTGK